MNQKIERYQLGLWAEKLAALFLMLKGYRILARRYKTYHGEIDLIIRRGKLIAFVEVKARHSKENGLEAITPRSQQRIMRAAEHFMQRHKKYQNYVWRFDALVVSPRSVPYHMPDAWRAT